MKGDKDRQMNDPFHTEGENAGEMNQSAHTATPDVHQESRARHRRESLQMNLEPLTVNCLGGYKT